MNNLPTGTDDGRSSSPAEELSPSAVGSEPAGECPVKPASYWRIFIEFPVTKIVLFAVLSLLFALIAIVVLMVLRKLNPGNLLFWGELALAVGAVGALWVMARLVERRPISSFGFGGRGASLRETAFGVLIGAGLMSLVLVVLVGAGWCRLTMNTLSAADHHTLARYLFFFLVVGVYEERVFRGYFFQTLESRWGTGAALGISMVVFGLLHIFNFGPRPSYSAIVGGFFIAAEAGLLFAAAYLWFRRLWMPIGIHWAWNLFEGPVYGAKVSGINITQSVFKAEMHGPLLMTGGPFGPEAGLPALIIGTVAGLILLRLAVRQGRWLSLSAIQAQGRPV